MRFPASAAAALALLCAACAGTSARGTPGPILTQSPRYSHWPVEGETRPGIFVRFEASQAEVPLEELLGDLRLVIDHGDRTQVVTGAAFAPVDGASNMQQTRYLYLPTSGVLFLTLELRRRGRELFPDTHRLELNDDCWHMLTYRIRGPLPEGPPPPPPWPRTSFLSPAMSPDPPLYLDVYASGNCFRHPLPPS